MSSDVNCSWLLGECLSFDLRVEDLAPLRTRLLAPNALFVLTEFAGQQGLLTVLAGRLLDNVLVPPNPPDRPGPASALSRYLASHRDRREHMTRHLRIIVAALNEIGVQPILLKGARSLWGREPAWRFLRDIDLLVPSDQAPAVQRALDEIAYRPDSNQPERPHHHHLAPLYNAGLNGWVEIHKRGGNRYAERLLSTSELIAASSPSRDNGISVGLLDPVTQLLHAVVHHHVGHGGDARGTLNLKGLYEFAWVVNELTTEQKQRLVDRSADHPRLAANLDLWLAAAARLFRLSVTEPFAVAHDARERAEAMLSGDRRAWWKYPGYGEEIRMAWATERLRRSAGGGGPVGRQILRWKAIASMLPAIRR